MYQSFLSLQSFHKIVLTLSNGLFCLMIFKILTLRKSYVASSHDPHGGTAENLCGPKEIVVLRPTHWHLSRFYDPWP